MPPLDPDWSGARLVWPLERGYWTLTARICRPTQAPAGIPGPRQTSGGRIHRGRPTGPEPPGPDAWDPVRREIFQRSSAGLRRAGSLRRANDVHLIPTAEPPGVVQSTAHAQSPRTAPDPRTQPPPRTAGRPGRRPGRLPAGYSTQATAPMDLESLISGTFRQVLSKARASRSCGFARSRWLPLLWLLRLPSVSSADDGPLRAVLHRSGRSHFLGCRAGFHSRSCSPRRVGRSGRGRSPGVADLALPSRHRDPLLGSSAQLSDVLAVFLTAASCRAWVIGVAVPDAGSARLAAPVANSDPDPTPETNAAVEEDRQERRSELGRTVPRKRITMAPRAGQGSATQAPGRGQTGHDAREQDREWSHATTEEIP